jgi:hypothetical protein
MSSFTGCCSACGSLIAINTKFKPAKKYQIIDKFSNALYKVDAICERKRRKQITFKGK